MNGFQLHNIEHSSASAINMWLESPSAWVAKYICKRQTKFGAAAQIGVRVEAAIVEVLTGGSVDEAVEAAERRFSKDNALNTNLKDHDRKAHIRPMVEQAVECLKEYGEPEFDGNVIDGRKQKKIELMCNGEGWKLPVIGYLDLDYPKHGLTVDIKTTQRMPTIITDSHQRQGAIYRAAKGNAAVRFLYVTPKKAGWHEIDEPTAALAQVKNGLNRQERFLRLGDAATLQSIVPTNEGSFYWTDDKDLKTELFGD